MLCRQCISGLTLEIHGFLLITILLLITIAPCIPAESNHDRYANHKSLTEKLQNLARRFPNQSHLYSIGKSVQGRDLWVLAVAARDPHRHVLLRPEVKYVANMHGDETVGRELLLRLAAYLLQAFAIDADVTRLLRAARVHILPSMNPDGFSIAREGCFFRPLISGRENSNGKDLNRNFPDLWTNNSNYRMEPETLAVVNWLDDIPFVLSANLHGGALVANYPYDTNPDNLPVFSPAPDHDVFEHLALTYVAYNKNMRVGCPRESFVRGITNGAQWYPVSGGMQDYNYGMKGVFETTLELSCCKYPHADKLQDHWLVNRKSLIQYLLQVNRGIRGIITDQANRSIGNASLKILGRNITFKSTSNGEFFRILLPGSYSLKVSGDSFSSKTVNFTILQNEPLLQFNVTVDSWETAVFTIDAKTTTTIAISQNEKETTFVSEKVGVGVDIGLQRKNITTAEDAEVAPTTTTGSSTNVVSNKRLTASTTKHSKVIATETVISLITTLSPAPATGVSTNTTEKLMPTKPVPALSSSASLERRQKLQPTAPIARYTASTDKIMTADDDESSAASGDGVITTTVNVISKRKQKTSAGSAHLSSLGTTERLAMERQSAFTTEPSVDQIVASAAKSLVPVKLYLLFLLCILC